MPSWVLFQESLHRFFQRRSFLLGLDLQLTDHAGTVHHETSLDHPFFPILQGLGMATKRKGTELKSGRKLNVKELGESGEKTKGSIWFKFGLSRGRCLKRLF